ncbi:tripartite motif-containing protein 16-like [Silurus meridionalis]|uniref:tripartite motif-containing protein 16-like n=1 Tax=Silurus meridionalis TaxID=175797 RepID=UPI001EEB5544|nr:tripartite motif-containing protein 16-like [Silurus meridionalis]
MDQDQLNCSECMYLLKTPVTLNCGHSFCKVCIKGCSDEVDGKHIYRCPRCRDSSTPRPVPRKNKNLQKMVGKLMKNVLQAGSPAQSDVGTEDVDCDICTGKKRKAIKSCLICQASFCEAHLKPHYQSQAFKQHQLVEACADLQEKFCFQHNKLIEIYCRTDQSFICYLCTMDKHKGHDTVAAKAERTEKQNELKEEQIKSQQMIQEKQKKVQEIKQTVDTIKKCSQAAVDDSEKIFNEMIRSLEKRRLEVTVMIKDWEKVELSRVEQPLKQLEQDIADLQRRVSDLEQLSHTPDHIHFLQSFPSLCVSPGLYKLTSFTVNQHLPFDGLQKSLSDLKQEVEKLCQKDFSNILPQAAAVQKILPLQPEKRHDFLQSAAIQKSLPSQTKKKDDFLQSAAIQKSLPSQPKRRNDFLQSAAVQKHLPSQPENRDEFLQYFCNLTLDPNTAHHQLILSENNTVVKRIITEEEYSDHPERFDYWSQVLCKESVCGRCYWEVEWSGDVAISVSYKDISRKGEGDESLLGYNTQSWSLVCFLSSVCFCHNSINTELQGPAFTRIGVYVDHSAGTLSFYSVSDTMRLLHKVQTTFTQPLYAGFCIGSYDSTVNLF